MAVEFNILFRRFSAGFVALSYAGSYVLDKPILQKNALYLLEHLGSSRRPQIALLIVISIF